MKDDRHNKVSAEVWRRFDAGFFGSITHASPETFGQWFDLVESEMRESKPLETEPALFDWPEQEALASWRGKGGNP